MSEFADYLFDMPDEALDAFIEGEFGYRLSDYPRGAIVRWKIRELIRDHLNRETQGKRGIH